jgi:hypothetical protein
MFLPLVLTGGIRAFVRPFADAARCAHNDCQGTMKGDDMPSQVTFAVPVVKSIPMYE